MRLIKETYFLTADNGEPFMQIELTSRETDAGDVLDSMRAFPTDDPALVTFGQLRLERVEYLQTQAIRRGGNVLHLDPSNDRGAGR